jgi:hypothetical protein
MHQMEMNTRRARGRLSREDQRRLGDILQKVYDNVVQQGVPDRFKDLINRLDQPGAVADADEHEETSLESSASETERGVQAHSKPKDQH